MERAAIISRVKIKMDEFTPPGVNLPFEDYIGPTLDEAAKELAEMVPLRFLAPISMVVLIDSTEIDTNVAIIKLKSPHGFVVGDNVTIAGVTTLVDYNGTFPITSVTPDSISYSLTHANANETGASGGAYVSPLITIEDNKAHIKVPSKYLRLYEMKFPDWVKPVREATKAETILGRQQENPYLRSGIGRPSVVIGTTQLTNTIPGEYFICGRVEALTTPPRSLYVPIQKPEELNDSLTDQLTWLCTVKMFIITGYPDKAKIVNEQFGLSMQLLINV